MDDTQVRMGVNLTGCIGTPVIKLHSVYVNIYANDFKGPMKMLHKCSGIYGITST